MKGKAILKKCTVKELVLLLMLIVDEFNRRKTSAFQAVVDEYRKVLK